MLWCCRYVAQHLLSVRVVLPLGSPTLAVVLPIDSTTLAVSDTATAAIKPTFDASESGAAAMESKLVVIDLGAAVMYSNTCCGAAVK